MPSILGASTIAEYLEESWNSSPGFAMAIAAIVHVAMIMALFGLIPMVFIWLERKVAGRIQDRLGPTRVGGRFGWLQGLADGIKLIQKEDLCPKEADPFLFRMAPYITCVAAICGFIVLPFSQGWGSVASDIALFVLFAILSIEVVGIILAGYSSGSKWSLFGGMREAAQMVSYEIPLAICGLVPIVALGTLNFSEISAVQRGWASNWMLFHDPFTFITFFVYFTVATAGCKRAPFDLAEAESELVGGFHTEYSGMRWSFFFMAEYAAMFLVSGVAVILFLGGWNSGIGVIDSFIDDVVRPWGPNLGFEGFVLGSYIANLFGLKIMLIKASLLVFVQIWVRWTLPRLRIDQVMTTCLKYLIPISCFLFLGSVLWPVVLSTTTGKTTLFDAVPLGDRFQKQVERTNEEPVKPVLKKEETKQDKKPAHTNKTAGSQETVSLISE
jgi:NADH:ubiquinone oxidoreductase subunit H